MALFRRSAEETSPGERAAAAASAPARSGRLESRLAAGTTVVGEIRSTTDVVVEGRVEGGIQAEKAAIRIEPGGTVEGNLRGRSVYLAGKLQGNLHAEDVAELAPTARLEGDLTAHRVVIAEGAFFKGSVTMQGSARSAARKAAAGEKPGGS
ncbi:MAG: polymer-forming cytoskeletal protein [Thermoanaerobaculia bacterium]